MPLTASATQTETRCPVSGLPLISSPGWADVPVGSDYRVTFSLIGGYILLLKMIGRVGTADVDLLFRERARVLKEAGATDRRIIEVRDYRAIIGEPSRQARVIQARHLMNCKDRLACFIVANAPWKIRATFRIGLRLFPPPCPFEIISDVNTAIRRAVLILATEEGIDLYAPDRLVRREGWAGNDDRFSWEIAVAPRLFVYSRVSGYLDTPEFERLYRCYCQVFTEGLIGAEPFFRIIDITGLDGMSWRARFQYPARLNEAHRENHVYPVATFFYGGKGVAQTLVSMITPFLSYDVLPAQNYPDAVRKILAYQKKRNPRARNIERISDVPAQTDPERTRVAGLVRYIGSLSWDAPEQEPPQNPGDPYAGVYEALSLVKADIQQLLAEQQARNRQLEEQNQELLEEVKRRSSEQPG